MRSGAYASSRQDTDYTGGRGSQEFRPRVCYQTSGCPDIDARTSPFKSLSHLLGPQGRRRFVRQLQGHSRRLWRLGSIVARVGRGTGDSLAASSGVCRSLGRAWRSYLPLSVPTGVQLALISPKLVQSRFSEVRLNGFSEATTVFRGSPCGERDIADTRRRTVPPPLEPRPAFFLVLPASGPF
jgi:hypothetical protein